MAALTVERLKRHASGKLADGSVTGLYWQANKDGTITAWCRAKDAAGVRREHKVSVLNRSGFTATDLRSTRHQADGFKIYAAPAKPTQTTKTHVGGSDTVEAGWAEFYRHICGRKDSAWSQDTQAKAAGRIDRYVATTKLWRKPLSEVSVRDVLMVLDPIRSIKPDTEKKVRQLLAKMFRHFVMLGEIPASPVEGISNLHQNLTKPPPKRHQPAVIDLVVLRDYVKRIEFQAGDRMVGWALMLQAMTAQRSTEIAKAQWSEFNDDCSVWTIPRSRMKMSIDDHTQPRGDQVLTLSRQAQELVQGIPREDGNPWVFRTRSPRALHGHISIEGLAKRMQAVVGESGKHVPHGFRRALRSNALQAVDEDGRPLFAEHWIEGVLDHQAEGKVKAAYTAGKPVDGMARVLQWWSDQLLGADK